jgi:hypothetical protein
MLIDQRPGRRPPRAIACLMRWLPRPPIDRRDPLERRTERRIDATSSQRRGIAHPGKRPRDCWQGIVKDGIFQGQSGGRTQ